MVINQSICLDVRKNVFPVQVFPKATSSSIFMKFHCLNVELLQTRIISFCLTLNTSTFNFFGTFEQYFLFLSELQSRLYLK